MSRSQPSLIGENTLITRPRHSPYTESPKRNLENLRNYGYRTEGTYLLNEYTIGTILFHKNRLLALEAILE